MWIHDEAFVNPVLCVEKRNMNDNVKICVCLVCLQITKQHTGYNNKTISKRHSCNTKSKWSTIKYVHKRGKCNILLEQQYTHSISLYHFCKAEELHFHLMMVLYVLSRIYICLFKSRPEHRNIVCLCMCIEKCRKDSRCLVILSTPHLPSQHEVCQEQTVDYLQNTSRLHYKFFFLFWELLDDSSWILETLKLIY